MSVVNQMLREIAEGQAKRGPWLFGGKRAPKGGVIINGHRYAGGEWIPGSVMAKARKAPVADADAVEAAIADNPILAAASSLAVRDRKAADEELQQAEDLYAKHWSKELHPVLSGNRNKHLEKYFKDEWEARERAKVEHETAKEEFKEAVMRAKKSRRVAEEFEGAVVSPRHGAWKKAKSDFIGVGEVIYDACRRHLSGNASKSQILNSVDKWMRRINRDVLGGGGIKPQTIQDFKSFLGGRVGEKAMRLGDMVAERARAFAKSADDLNDAMGEYERRISNAKSDAMFAKALRYSVSQSRRRLETPGFAGKEVNLVDDFLSTIKPRKERSWGEFFGDLGDVVVG